MTEKIWIVFEHEFENCSGESVTAWYAFKDKTRADKMKKENEDGPEGDRGHWFVQECELEENKK
jgi:hypothetical protein